MTIQYINTGTSPNAGNGDTLRFAFHKINQNFEYILSAEAAVSYLLRRDNNTSTQVTLQADGRLTVPGPIYQGTAWDGIFYADTIFKADADTDSFAQMLLQNHNTGIGASTDLVIMNDQGTETSNYIDLGINSSNYEVEEYGVTGAGDGYLFTNNGNLVIGTQTPNKKLVFHAGGTEVNSSGGYLDEYAWRFNRSVQVIFGTGGPLNFTVQNTLDNSAATAVYQAINDAGVYAQFGITSSNLNFQDGLIGPGEVFFHGHNAGATTHIGNRTDLALYADQTNGYAGVPALLLKKNNQDAIFRGRLIPKESNTQDLGESNYLWRNLYLASDSAIYFGNLGVGISTNGEITVNGNSIITTISDTSPNTLNGSLWFNTDDGRLYIKYNNAWIDASPQVTPPSILPNDAPGYLANDGAGNLSWSSGTNLFAVEQSIIPAVNNLYDLGSTSSQWRSLYVSTSTIYLGGTSLSVNQSGELLVGGSLITGGGNNTWQLTSSTHVVTLKSDGNVMLPDGTEMGVLEGAGTFGFNNTNTLNQFLIQLGNKEWSFHGINTGDFNFPYGSYLNENPYAETVTLDQLTAISVWTGTLTFTKLEVDEYRALPDGPGMFLSSSTWSLNYDGQTYYTSTDLINWIDGPSAGGNPAPIGTPSNAKFNIIVDENNTFSFSGNGSLILPSGLTFEPISNYIPVLGTVIQQAAGNLNIISTSTGNSMAIGWVENPFSPGPIASMSFNETSGTVSVFTGDFISTTYNWKFDSNGALILPNNGTITEGEGLTNKAIKLTPADGSTATQALLIYPTFMEGDHLHLTAGGGNTELYLGDDSQFVALTSTGGVKVQAKNTLTNYQWIFSENGRLKVPSVGIAPEHSYGVEGDLEGMLAFDNTYIYFCTANYVNTSTNIWKRVAWSGDTW